MRTSVVIGLIAALMLTLVGCDRSQESQQIESAIAQLPGVQTATHRYSNVFSKDTSFALSVRVRPDITPEQLTNLWKVFVGKVDKADYSGYAVSLDVRLCPEPQPSPQTGTTTSVPDSICHTMDSDVQTNEANQPAPPWPEWLGLIRGGYGSVSGTTATFNGRRTRTLGISVTAPDDPRTAVTATFRRLRAQFPMLGDIDGWSVTAADNRLGHPDLATRHGYPDDRVLGLWSDLDAISATAAEFEMRPTESTVDTVSTRLTGSTEAEWRTTAVAQLNLLKAYGQVVRYTASSKDNYTFVILANGCPEGPRPTGFSLYSELRRQFEKCPR